MAVIGVDMFNLLIVYAKLINYNEQATLLLKNDYLCETIIKIFKQYSVFNMALWFECKVRYERLTENGAVKKVNEPYLVDALTFTEAEARIIEKITPFISGDFSISAVKKTRISEIFFDETGDRYFQVKVNFITLDEKSGAEKRSANYILVQANDLRGALDKFEEGMKGTVADYEVASIAETPIMDVFPISLTLGHETQTVVQ